MKKVLIVLIIFLLFGCQTLFNFKIDMTGKVYIYSVYATVDMQGQLPEDVVVQFHAEIEVIFQKNNKCVIKNTNYTTVNNYVADKIINQMDFDYVVIAQRIYLTNDFYFEFGDNCLIYDTGDEVIKLKASGNIYK